jgi:thiamine biosynthesis lipoprotein
MAGRAGAVSKSVGVVLLGVAGIVAVLLLLRPGRPRGPLEARRIALGTSVAVKLYDGRRLDAALLDTAYAQIARIEAQMSRYSDSSEASRIEREAFGQDFDCSPEMAEVLGLCQVYAARSDGRFDVTVGALTRLWGFPDARQPPAPAQIDSARALVGYRDLLVDGRRVRLRRPGVRIDLGAAAKGYAVDRAIARLQALGVTAGLVEAGGDLRCWGSKPDGTPWRIGVQHPRDPGRFARADDIGLPAVATSGDYEQYFIVDGRRYHHLLDPSTGYPASAAVSATAWTTSAMEADILATTVFVLGPDAGLRLAESLPEVEALVYYVDGDTLRHRGTSGVEGRVHFSDGDQ